LTQPPARFLTGGQLFFGAVTVAELAFQDFTPGRVFEHGPRSLPCDEMIAFAAEFDPQPMHLDEAAARQTMLGGLSASGWYLCCILMRMCVEAFVGRSSSMGAPGVEEVRWLLPVRPEDELSLRATVLDTRGRLLDRILKTMRTAHRILPHPVLRGKAGEGVVASDRQPREPPPSPSPGVPGEGIGEHICC